MMRPSAVLFALATIAATAVALPSAAEAQAALIQRDAPLDARREAIKQELLVFRDTLQQIRAATAQFVRDTRTTSDALARSRVLRMSHACAAAKRRLPVTRSVVEDGRALEGAGVVAAGQDRRRAALLGAMKRLDTTVRWCEEEFRGLAAPEQAEEARYGTLKRSERLRADLRAYDSAVDAYLLGLGIRVLPLGATDPALAG